MAYSLSRTMCFLIDWDVVRLVAAAVAADCCCFLCIFRCACTLHILIYRLPDNYTILWRGRDMAIDMRTSHTIQIITATVWQLLLVSIYQESHAKAFNLVSYSVLSILTQADIDPLHSKTTKTIIYY